jgi:hypothetical protein
MESLIPPEVVWPFVISASAGFGLIVLVFLIRLHYQLEADVKRQTYELCFPSGMTKHDLMEFVPSLSTVPKPGFLRPLYPVVFEHYADHLGSRYFLSTPGGAEESVDKLFLEHIKGQMELVDVDPVAETVWDAAREYNTSVGALTNTFRITSMEGAAATIGTAFKDLQAGEIKVMQWTILPDRPRRPTPENKDKVSEHTFHVLLRIGAKGERPKNMLDGIISPFFSVASSDARLKQRLMTGVVDRLRQRTSALAHMGYLNATELATVFGWPLDGSGPRMARRLAPTAAHDEPGDGLITLGTSNAPKMKHRKVAMPVGAGDMHQRYTGISGSGKSVFLLNEAVQYAAMPDVAFMMIEPSGDLAEDFLKSIPEHRAKDVAYFNPLDTGYPIGLNPLKGADPEQVASHIVSMFKTLYKDTWSASMQRVMTTAVTTAALLDGTLYDAMLLLTSEDYRSAELKKLKRPQYPDLYESWDSIIRRGDIATDSTVNRFHSLMGFRTVRNILSQRDGLDFDAIIRDHKILIMPLPGARMGPTNASIIGSLAREMMQSAAMRQPPPADSRNRAVLMMDEAQNYLGESLSQTDAFAELRKFKLQLIIAHQYLDQLPKDIQHTVAQNVATQGTFRSSPEEARLLKGRFAPLGEDDLSELGRYEMALRVNSSGGIAPTVTIKTAPPPSRTPYASWIIQNTRKTYARPRAEVEAEIAARHKRPEAKKKPTIGIFEDDA